MTCLAKEGVFKKYFKDFKKRRKSMMEIWFK